MYDYEYTGVIYSVPLIRWRLSRLSEEEIRQSKLAWIRYHITEPMIARIKSYHTRNETSCL